MRTLLLALAACTTSEPGAAVGTVDGTDAVVGLATDGDVGRLYVCGGPDTMGVLNRWFDVWIGERLEGESEGWTVSGSRGEGVIVDPDGVAWSFALSAAEGAEGPYAPDASVGECPAGVVVVGDRVQGVACASALAPAQVVPVGVIGAEPGPIEVRTEGEPALEFVVVPVAP
jgi:hypothetical protein